MRAVYRLLFHLERDGVKVAPLNVVPIGSTEHIPFLPGGSYMTPRSDLMSHTKSVCIQCTSRIQPHTLMISYHIRAADRPKAVHLCHVTSAITPLSRSLGEEEEAAPALTHTSQPYPSPIADLLVSCSPYSYNASTRALLSANQHPLFHDMQKEGG
jgi:hypothetical protein